MATRLSQKKCLTIPWPEAQSEKAFLQSVVRTARQEARKFYREQHPVKINPGGRPSLKNKVAAACESVWKQWGERFPCRRSSLAELVREVAKRIPGKREDMRTIEAHARNWVKCRFSPTEVPEGLLKTRHGQQIIRQKLLISIIGDLIKNHGLTLDCKSPAPTKELLKERTRRLASIPDKKLLRLFIASRK